MVAPLCPTVQKCNLIISYTTINNVRLWFWNKTLLQRDQSFRRHISLEVDLQHQQEHNMNNKFLHKVPSYTEEFLENTKKLPKIPDRPITSPVSTHLKLKCPRLNKFSKSSVKAKKKRLSVNFSSSVYNRTFWLSPNANGITAISWGDSIQVQQTGGRKVNTPCSWVANKMPGTTAYRVEPLYSRHPYSELLDRVKTNSCPDQMSKEACILFTSLYWILFIYSAGRTDIVKKTFQQGIFSIRDSPPSNSCK